jgi:hypothetical protein
MSRAWYLALLLAGAGSGSASAAERCNPPHKTCGEGSLTFPCPPCIPGGILSRGAGGRADPALAERYRLRLEDYRLELEEQRQTGEASPREYQKGIEEYKEGVSTYRGAARDSRGPD